MKLVRKVNTKMPEIIIPGCPSIFPHELPGGFDGVEPGGEKRNYIFLDVDGVLNFHCEVPLNVELLANLAVAVKETNAKVVISSSWREFDDMVETLEGFLEGVGIRHCGLTEPNCSKGVSIERYIKAHDCGAGTEMASHLFGHFKMMTTISTACSSAANSIILGADLIKAGKVKAAIVGGTESLSKFHLNGFNSLMILEHQPCRPFDKNNQGLNLGEGAGFIIIEDESSALKRGANIICELSGYANACDAYPQTATSANSEGATAAMTKAISNSHLQPSDIDYINAHGTGTADNDLHESIALKRVFGENVPDFSSTKGFTGHTTSAAGAVESVISIIALQNGFIPANIGFSEPIEETGLKPVSKTTPKELTHVMTNSFGFGGNDSSVLLSDSPTDLPPSPTLNAQRLTPVTVVSRTDSNYSQVIVDIVQTIETFLALTPKQVAALRKEATAVGKQADWTHFFPYYEQAYHIALTKKRP